MAVGRWLRSRVVVAVLLVFALAAFLLHGVGEKTQPRPIYQDQSFHLLVPATSSNDNLCRLLLSAAINRYPVPILINWAAKENKDAYVQHLAKVWTILDYLEVMLKRGQKDDLVLIIDGFDIHFQLPPEVLISRYYAENERANKRIAKQVGADVALAQNIKQTVIFGHDKLCWPTNWRRPACWLVPEASDPKKAFGPLTETNPTVSRARWLNSGTILGPVEHIRDIFQATLDLIHSNHTTDSDQFYFANIWAAQEHSRHLAEPEPYKGINRAERDFPELKEGQRTEYFFGLDYEGVLFQTMAFFREYIVWETFNGVLPKKKPSSIWKTSSKNQQIIKRDPYYLKVLPEDIARSRGPFDAVSVSQQSGNIHQSAGGEYFPAVKELLNTTHTPIPTNLTWSNLSLGVNANSNQIFPLLHFTGPKEFRKKWWPRLWFLPWAEELLIASVAADRVRQPFLKTPIGGKKWWPGLTGFEDLALQKWGRKGGAWSDKGVFLSWDQKFDGDDRGRGLCGAHEDVIYGRKEDRSSARLKNGG